MKTSRKTIQSTNTNSFVHSTVGFPFTVMIALSLKRYPNCPTDSPHQDSVSLAPSTYG